MAQFSEGNYILNDKQLSKNERFKQVNASLPDGYVLQPQSNRDIALYTNADKKHSIISHRGTDLSSKKDLTADLMFVLGKEQHSKEFQKRTKRTENLLKYIPNDHALTLQGHSYGGASALTSAVQSAKTRNRVDKIDLYNPLTAGDHSHQKIDTAKHETKQDAIDMLNDMTTTNRTKNDVVSLTKSQYGNVKTFKQKAKYKSVPKLFKPIFKGIDQLDAHGLHNFKK